MVEFLGEKIEVEHQENSPRPVRFRWRGELHTVMDILQERVDVGFGSLPPGSRRWYTRRHRRYYVVRDKAGDVFEMYLDYANRKRRTWWLVRKTAPSPPGAKDPGAADCSE